MIKGIDVSHHQGKIDYNEMIKNHPEIAFVIAKATEGRTFVDSQFDRNMAWCREKNLLRGAYHYVRGDVDPISQATHFCEIVSSHDDPDILLALDVEDKTLTCKRPLEVVIIVETIAAEVYSRMHTYPLIYVSRAFMRPDMFSKLGELCGGWIAAWGEKCPRRKDLNTSIWQYTDKGRVQGIGGKQGCNVDLDQAFITPENWIKIANPEGLRT